MLFLNFIVAPALHPSINAPPHEARKVNNAFRGAALQTAITPPRKDVPFVTLRLTDPTRTEPTCSGAVEGKSKIDVSRRAFLTLGASTVCGVVAGWTNNEFRPALASVETIKSPALRSPAADSVSSVYDLSVFKDGKPLSLKDYSGKVTLFVNVASYCAFTPQYKGLVRLHDLYKSQDFEIVASPCNQFARQEPESDAEICSRVKDTFGVEFLLVDKLIVNETKNGETGSVAPLYRYLRDNAPEKKGAPITWNFEKFLVNRDGQVLRRYSPVIRPDDLEEDVRFAIDHPEKNLPPRPKAHLGA